MSIRSKYFPFILIALCTLGLSLSAFNFAYSGSSLIARLEFLAVFWEDIAGETNLDGELIQSWIPESGIRGRYQLAKSVLSLETLEGIVGEEAFVTGPHTNGVNYTSKTDFGRYNPDFVESLQAMLSPIYDNQTFVQNVQYAYDSYMRDYLRVYYLSYEVGAHNQEIADGYLEALSQYSPATGGDYPPHSEYLQESFRGFAEGIDRDGYDVYEGFVCPGFWVRRTIDGTADEFYSLLVLTMETFDSDFLD